MFKKKFYCSSETTTDKGQTVTLTEVDSNDSFSMPELTIDVAKGTFKEGEYYVVSIEDGGPPSADTASSN
jgi:hypothetical protein